MATSSDHDAPAQNGPSPGGHKYGFCEIVPLPSISAGLGRKTGHDNLPRRESFLTPEKKDGAYVRNPEIRTRKSQMPTRNSESRTQNRQNDNDRLKKNHNLARCISFANASSSAPSRYINRFANLASRQKIRQIQVGAREMGSR